MLGGGSTMGCAEMASPSGISSVWCSCAKDCPVRYSRASRRRGRDMVGIRVAEVERAMKKDHASSIR